MLSKEEIQENTMTISYNEYVSMTTEIKVSKAARTGLLEQQYINDMLKTELEKYKRIAVGDTDEREAVICENYDRVLNDADTEQLLYQKKHTEPYDTDAELEGMISYIRTFLPCDEIDDHFAYIFRRYHLQYRNFHCEKCESKYKINSTFPLTTFRFVHNKAMVFDEIFPGYRCEKCGNEIPNLYGAIRQERTVLDNPKITEEVIAYLIVQKYVYHRSFRSLELFWKQQGLHFSAITMCMWVNEVCDRWLVPLYEAMRAELLRREMICTGSRGIRNLTITDNEYVLQDHKMMEVFVYRTHMSEQKPIILFDAVNDYQYFDEDVSYAAPAAFLKGYKGIVHTDQIERFNCPDRQYSLAAMWGMLEERFQTAAEVYPEEYLDDSEATRCLNVLSKIEEYEQECVRLEDSPVRCKLREKYCRKYTDKLTNKAADFDGKEIGSMLGKAYASVLDYIDELETFFTDPRTRYDNRSCQEELELFGDENRNRFVYDPDGYKRSLAMLSIMRTVKANGLNPERYLTYYLKNAVQLHQGEKKEKLFPWNCSPRCKEILLYNMDVLDF